MTMMMTTTMTTMRMIQSTTGYAHTRALALHNTADGRHEGPPAPLQTQGHCVSRGPGDSFSSVTARRRCTRRARDGSQFCGRHQKKSEYVHLLASIRDPSALPLFQPGGRYSRQGAGKCRILKRLQAIKARGRGRKAGRDSDSSAEESDGRLDMDSVGSGFDEESDNSDSECGGWAEPKPRVSKHPRTTAMALKPKDLRHDGIAACVSRVLTPQASRAVHGSTARWHLRPIWSAACTS
jgi:hypothetical protein